jgi:transcriptional regulator with XRE-family HTH domain
MNWKKELATQLKYGRESAGLTQADLARQLDLSRQMISRYEAGHDTPGLDILIEIARMLDMEFRIRGVLIKFERAYKS